MPPLWTARLVYLTWMISRLRVDPLTEPLRGPVGIETDMYLYSRFDVAGRTGIILADGTAAWLNDPQDKLVERIGIEPMTPCLQSRCSTI